jgi:hypothetical protein
MPNSTRMLWQPLRSAAFGAIGAAYAQVGNPFDFPLRIIDVTNLTNANILISFDGVNDHMIVPAASGKVRDICAARDGGDLSTAQVAQNTQVWAKRENAAPTSGTLYIEGNYTFGD